MMLRFLRFRRLGAALLIAVPSLLHAGEQEAIDGCIDRLREVAGPVGGQVLSSEFSEAATLVMLLDARGTTWRCLAYSDGTVGELSVAAAGSGGGGGGSGDRVRVQGVPPGDVLNMRGGPGTGFGVVGALANGDTVRLLTCESNGGARWCRIRLLDDMGGEGWVNGRYLSRTTAGTSPKPPAAKPSGAERIRFAPGTSGAEIVGQLLPQGRQRYLLGARNGQFLTVRLGVDGPGMIYNIINPDGTMLLDRMPGGQTYRGQLWQSGDHVVEVINTANGAQGYRLGVGID